MSGIVSPYLMQALAAHFNSTVDLRAPETIQDEAGQEVTVHPPTDKRIKAYKEPLGADQEVRREDQTLVTEGYNFVLQGYFPDVNVEYQLVDLTTGLDELYDIIKVVSDDSRTFTIITAEKHG